MRVGDQPAPPAAEAFGGIDLAAVEPLGIDAVGDPLDLREVDPEQAVRLVSLVRGDHDQLVAAVGRGSQPLGPVIGELPLGQRPLLFRQPLDSIEHAEIGAVQVGHERQVGPQPARGLVERRHVVEVQDGGFVRPGLGHRLLPEAVRWSPSSGETAAKTRSGTFGAFSKEGWKGTGSAIGSRPAWYASIAGL